jgi:hypothetical protein
MGGVHIFWYVKTLYPRHGSGIKKSGHLLVNDPFFEDSPDKKQKTLVIMVRKGQPDCLSDI